MKESATQNPVSIHSATAPSPWNETIKYGVPVAGHLKGFENIFIARVSTQNI